MEKNEIKKMEKKERRNFILAKLQYAADNVLWSIRDNDPSVMMDVQRYKQFYRIYRNIKLMEGEHIYNSPRYDMNVEFFKWESE